MTVSLYLRIRTAQGALRYAAATSASRRLLRPLEARVGGRIERHPEGVYCLCYRRQGKLVWEPVGRSRDAALAAQAQRTIELNRHERMRSDGHSGTPLIQDRIDLFIGDKRDEANHGRPARFRTLRKYRYEFRLFLSFINDRRRTLEEITTDDLEEFKSWLREQGLKPRSCSNAIKSVLTLMRHFYITPPRVSLPKFKLKNPDEYAAHEIEQLLLSCKPVDRLWVETLLATGLRNEEMATLEGCNLIQIGDAWVLDLHPKPWRNMELKDYERREIPIAADLGRKLAALNCGPRELFFPSPTGKVDLHFLRRLKRIARRAGLEGPWTLQKMRRTHTNMIRNVIPIEVAKDFLGHATVTTTLRHYYARAKALKSENQAGAAQLYASIAQLGRSNSVFP